MEQDRFNIMMMQEQIEETAGKRHIRLIPDERFREFEKRMLCDSSCPYTLPMHFMADHGNDTVFYDFTGHIQLTDYIKSEKTFDSDAKDRGNGKMVCETLKLLIGIMECVKGMERYLLFSERYSLHSDFIFVNSDSKKPAIAFYPVVQSNKTLQQKIQELIDALTCCGDDDTGKYLNQFKQTIDFKNPGLDGMISLAGKLCRDAGYIYWNPDSLRSADPTISTEKEECGKEMRKVAVKKPLKRLNSLKYLAIQGIIAALLTFVFFSGYFDCSGFAGLAIIAVGVDLWIVRRLRFQVK
jgi:hypothetical protein